MLKKKTRQSNKSNVWVAVYVTFNRIFTHFYETSFCFIFFLKLGPKLVRKEDYSKINFTAKGMQRLIA